LFEVYSTHLTDDDSDLQTLSHNFFVEIVRVYFHNRLFSTLLNKGDYIFQNFYFIFVVMSSFTHPIS